MWTTIAPASLRGATDKTRRKFASYVKPTGIERTFNDNDVIVSKTDTKGIITYANDVFLDMARMSERDAIGQPHSLIRHPDMPRSIFKLLWDTIQRGDEIFAYVQNLSSTGDHYWVFAHVTPTLAADGSIIGYHSNRRVPHPTAIAAVKPLYSQLKAIEDNATNRAEGLRASSQALTNILRERGSSYDEFVFSFTR